MTWVAWRVQRSTILAAIAVVSVLALWLVATGLVMGHSQTWKYWTDADVYVLFALPGVLGLAIGAPLIAGESNLGTDRLATTQSVTRARWLTYKLLVGGFATAGIVLVLTLILRWWTGAVSVSALTQSGGFSGVRIQPDAFDLTGLVVVGYTLFAFFLGTALGHEPFHYTIFYVQVDDVQAYLDKAGTLGAKTLVPPVKIPTGTFAWLADPDGNTVGLWQPAA